MRSLNHRALLVLGAAVLPPLVLLGAHMAPSVKRAAGPRISIAQDTADFGRVAPGERRIATFAFSNSGSSRLSILAWDTSCGCAEPEFSTRELQPAATGTIRVAFHAPSAVGPVHHTIQLQTNGIQEERPTLHVRALVGKGIIPFPSHVNMTRIRAGQTRTRSVELYSIENKPFAITQFGLVPSELASHGVTVEAELNEAKPSHQLTLSVAAVEPGTLKGELFVNTDSAENPSITVPVEIDVVGRVAPTPSALMLGSRKPSEHVRTRVRLDCEEGTIAVKKVGFREMSSEVHWSFTPTDERQGTLEIEFTMPETVAGKGLIEDELIIALSQEDNEVVKLPVLVIVK